MARFRVLLGLILLLTLSGCSPDPDPYFALIMSGDRPTLLIADCALGKISYVSLRERPLAATSASPPLRAELEWTISAPLAPASPGGTIKVATADAPAALPFFDRPAEWNVQRNSLHEFREEAFYDVSGGPANVASLTFTTADLRALPAGQVLTAKGYRDQQILSTQDFQKAANRTCAP